MPIDALNKQDGFFVSLLEMMSLQFVSRKGAVVAALQFLNVVTEENQTLQKKFAENHAACKFLIDFISLKSNNGEESNIIRILVACETPSHPIPSLLSFISPIMTITIAQIGT